MKHLKFFIFLCILSFTVSCGQQKRYIQYKVKKGETMSKIAQKLDMKTANLLRLNPDVNGEPKTNSYLVVPEKKIKKFEEKIRENKEDIIEFPTDDLVNGLDSLNVENDLITKLKKLYVTYEVKKGDTFYNLNKLFDVTRGELLLLNPELAKGLKVGMILKIKKIPTKIIAEEVYYNDYIDYNKDLKVALLLPFRTQKYRSDTLLLKEIFANNSTLVNIATDFYLGAEIAIDSLRKKGIKIQLNTYDTGNRRGNGVLDIISENDLNSNNVVIGPLYSEEVTTVAANVNIPVIYPVYSDDQSGFSSSNIVKTSPDKKVFREELEKYIKENFNKVDIIDDNNSMDSTYISSKGGNIIIVSDDNFKSLQTSKLMQSTLSFSTSAVVSILTQKDGYIEKSRFLDLLKPEAKNWVIIATDDNIIVNDAINSLISLPEETTVKVFTYDKGSVYNKVDNRKLAKIGFTYVSDEFVDENSLGARIFNKQYEKKNNALPSFYATKGFDITYDILIRLASSYELKTTLDEGMSVRVEAKFDYRNSTYLSENKGLFIVQYNKDLSLTKLK